LDLWGVDPVPPSPSAASLMPIVRGQSEALRDRLCILGSGPERAIRTPAWYLRAAAEDLPSPGTDRRLVGRGAGGEGDAELFAKPDDRWEVNNVASRCAEVVDGLQNALAQYELALPVGRVCDLPRLSDMLRDGME
jgi:hypothetical protein